MTMSAGQVFAVGRLREPGGPDRTGSRAMTKNKLGAAMTSDSAQTTAIIDGLHVQVLPGETVLDAARRFGIDIPTLCNISKLSSRAFLFGTD